MLLTKSKKSFNKKGVTDVLVYIILGLLVIGVIAFLVPPILKGSLSDFLKFTRAKTNVSTEFTPYETTLSADEIAADNSMKALVFAINSVATDEQTGKKFGDSTVGCTNEGCTVKNFFLPQQISNTGEMMKPETWLAGYGDPRWLVYYEAFPDGADAYWHTDGTSLFNTMSVGFIVAGGILNIIPGGGKAAKVGAEAGEDAVKKALKEVGEETAQALLKQGGKDVLERVAANGAANTIRSFAIEDGLKNIYGIGESISKELTDKILSVAGKKGGEATFENELRSQFEKELSPIVSKITQKPSTFTGSIESYRAKVLDDIIDGTDNMIVEFSDGDVRLGLKGIFSKPITQTMKRDLFSKRFTESFFRQFISETGAFDEKLFRETAEKAITSLDAMSPSMRDIALRAAATSLDGLLKGTAGVTSAEFKQQILARPIRYPIQFIADQIPLKGLTLGSLTKSAVNLPQWAVNHKYPIMLLVLLASQEADSMSEKKMPVGDNSLALNQPSLFGLTAVYKLSSEARKYFIALEDTIRLNELKGRLYLASPCKADLKVIKTKCTCNANPALHRFNFGGGLQDVKVNSVKIKDDITDENKQKAAQELYKYVIANPYSALAGSDFTYWESVLQLTRPERTQDPTSKSFQIMDSYFDTSEAIRECQPKGIVDGVVDWNKQNIQLLTKLIPGNKDTTVDSFYNYVQYDVDCIKIQVDKQDYQNNENYCYDAFPGTEWARDALTLSQAAVDLWVTGAIATYLPETGGTSAVAGTAALVTSGMGFATVDAILARSEKWP